ncbi:unnamed protein product, partial [Amoebophrya sp. A120]
GSASSPGTSRGSRRRGPQHHTKTRPPTRTSSSTKPPSWSGNDSDSTLPQTPERVWGRRKQDDSGGLGSSTHGSATSPEEDDANPYNQSPSSPAASSPKSGAGGLAGRFSQMKLVWQLPFPFLGANRVPPPVAGVYTGGREDSSCQEVTAMPIDVDEEETIAKKIDAQLLPPGSFFPCPPPNLGATASEIKNISDHLAAPPRGGPSSSVVPRALFSEEDDDEMEIRKPKSFQRNTAEKQRRSMSRSLPVVGDLAAGGIASTERTADEATKALRREEVEAACPEEVRGVFCVASPSPPWLNVECATGDLSRQKACRMCRPELSVPRPEEINPGPLAGSSTDFRPVEPEDVVLEPEDSAMDSSYNSTLAD